MRNTIPQLKQRHLLACSSSLRRYPYYFETKTSSGANTRHGRYRGFFTYFSMYQGKGLELLGQRKIPSASYLACGMKRRTSLVITTESFNIWWIHWMILARRNG